MSSAKSLKVKQDAKLTFVPKMPGRPTVFLVPSVVQKMAFSEPE